jgi:hypothetical protein
LLRVNGTSVPYAFYNIFSPLKTLFPNCEVWGLGRMKLILSHHLPKLPRLANPANSDLSREFSDVYRSKFQGG